MHRLPPAARAAALLVSCLVLHACAGLRPSSGSDTQPVTQLPRTVRPLHYDVALAPDPQALRFDAQVAIAIEVLQPTRSITLHAAGLVIRKVGLSGTLEDEAGAGAATTTLDEAAQTATFTFERTIQPGRYLLVVEYSGSIATQPFGLFAIDYDTDAGPRRALYTQLQTADARRVLPSWDEPAWKATFTLEATVPADQTAVSNMPVAGIETLGDGLTRVRFAPTPKMSTYLLFFALGDFERIARQVDGADVGIVTRRGAGAHAAFALEASAAILREYNEYFGMPYPLPKLDNVAAPAGSQQIGAMENWGAILTFEYAILLDPTISTQADRQLVFEMAAHEISHQWFGDLVTMQWWDDLWLNEGFASWMEWRTTARLQPGWNTALSAVRTRDVAIERDALETTHPVVQPIATVEEANQAFDAITYLKGEAVVRMLEDWIGSEAWQEGVRRYLRAHTYGSTTSADLWRAMEAVTGKPVAAVARDFTLQPGVPLIRVERADCAQGSTALRLAQGEFTKDRPDKRPLAWRVPVVAAVPGAAPARALVRGEATVAVPGCGAVVVNAGQTGYYRTLYAPGPFAAILRAFAAVPAIDQLGILSDSWALGLAGLQPVSDFLSLAAATPIEADPQVWARIAGIFATLDDYYPAGADRERSRRFARARLAPVLARTGWSARSDEASAVAVLRNRLIETLGALDDAAVVAEARRRWAADASGAEPLPAALRKPVLAVVARRADAPAWDALHAAARAEKAPLVREELYRLLGSSDDPALARRALALALSGEPPATAAAEILRTVSLRHPQLTLDFVLERHDEVMALVEVPARSRFVPVLVAQASDPALAARVEQYAAERLAADARGDAQAAAANVRYRARVRTTRLPEIDAWLSARETEGAAPPAPAAGVTRTDRRPRPPA
jgi:aminopeptidase N